MECCGGSNIKTVSEVIQKLINDEMNQKNVCVIEAMLSFVFFFLLTINEFEGLVF